jgi:hypothetical protein
MESIGLLRSETPEIGVSGVRWQERQEAQVRRQKKRRQGLGRIMNWEL